ncbi:MAG: PQQ-binding-like beta-propeller repeat protein [Pirellulaceae bacterium]
MNKTCPSWITVVFLVCCVSETVCSNEPTGWPNWRGPRQDGISFESPLIDRFQPKGGADSHVLWKSEPAAGISTPVVMDGRLFTIVRDQPHSVRDAEKIVCLDATTGDVLWENRYNVFLSDVPAERVGWSHCSADPPTGKIYALGACSLLQCFDAKTGETLWARSLSEEFGMLSTYGGRTNTPVIFEDLVIISGVITGWDETARPTHRFLAFDKNNGTLVWQTGTRPLPEDTTYSTPFVTFIHGQATMIAGSGDGGIHAFQVRTGKPLWQYSLSRRGVNMSPLVVGDRIFVSHAEENPQGTEMGAVAALQQTVDSTGTQVSELWRIEGITAGRSSPLYLDGRLYVVDDGAGLRVLDADSGEQIGKTLKLGTSMRGSLVYGDGKIYACSATGVFHVLRPTEDGVKSEFKVRLPAGEECGGSPVIANGRIYLPTTGGLYCLGDESTVAASVSLSNNPTPIEADVTDHTVAQVQLVRQKSCWRRDNALPSKKCDALQRWGQRALKMMQKPQSRSRHLMVRRLMIEAFFERIRYRYTLRLG